MGLLTRLPLDELTPARLWAELDDDTRTEAARALFAQSAGRREGNAAVASAIRFREAAVRKLPLDKRIDYLLTRVVADDSLASSLLLALHLGERATLLGAFLDRLEIPHRDGLIDDEHATEPPPVERLEAAVRGIEREFPAAEVEVYLATLLALDDVTWGGLRQVVSAR